MKFYTLIIFVLFCSCSFLNNGTEDKLLGLWQIDSFNMSNLNYIDSLYLNTLIFKEGSLGMSLVLPQTESYNREYAYVKLNEKESSLSIESVNPNFRGVYKIIFFKNQEKQLLGVKLESNKNVIIAYKAQQDYEIDGINW